MRIIVRLVLFSFLVVLFFSCVKKEENYTPKPRGYFRIELPEHSYKHLDTTLPFAFDYSNNAVLSFSKKENGKYWIDITYPQFNASFNITYIPLDNNLRDLALAEEKMIKFHIDYGKADDVEFSLIEDAESHLSGRLFDILGKEVACPLQFWLTDSTNHYLRGSLYFNFAPNNDSLQPVINYLRTDALYMINSFSWK